MKYVINPVFSGLKEKLLELPVRFEHEGEVIYRGRNLIKIMEVEGLKVNVKSFKVPHLVNRFVYCYLRKSKAERSYLNALLLLKMGIKTPQPLAYIIYKGYLGISRSYYISVQQECDYVLLELLQQRPVDFEELLKAYVHFVYGLHQQGIYFVDLSTGNTLIQKESNGQHCFYLVDLNRIVFYHRPLTIEERMKNFSRIDLSEEDMDFVVKEYAVLSGEKYSFLRQMLKENREKEIYRRQRKKRLKKLIGKKSRD